MRRSGDLALGLILGLVLEQVLGLVLRLGLGLVLNGSLPSSSLVRHILIVQRLVRVVGNSTRSWCVVEPRNRESLQSSRAYLDEKVQTDPDEAEDVPWLLLLPRQVIGVSPVRECHTHPNYVEQHRSADQHGVLLVSCCLPKAGRLHNLCFCL